MLNPKFVELNPAELIAALDSEPPVSIRYNPLKMCSHRELESVPWCRDGYYLSERPIFTVDPLFHGGVYYVQEASSMFIGWIVEHLELGDDVLALDLCAAPGGKTTQLAGCVRSVVANEVIRPRAKILSENVQRWGSGNIAVTSNDPRDFGERAVSLFDLIVVDTPCSGEGMFRKDHAARDEWSEEAVAMCAARSRRIVSDVWPALRDGGVLIYSTCTFNRFENEENAHWICRELGGELIEIDGLPHGVVASDAGFRFSPHLVKGEGFYAVAIRKNGDERRTEPSLRRSAKSMTIPTKDEANEARRWVGSELHFAIGGGSLYGFTEPLWGIVEFLRANFNLCYSGVMMGELIRSALKPSHALATYHNVLFDNAVDLPLDAAVEYLRRGNLSLDYFPNDGLTLIKYQGSAVGWLKRIGNRVNNLYPQGLRILHY